MRKEAAEPDPGDPPSPPGAPVRDDPAQVRKDRRRALLGAVVVSLAIAGAAVAIFRERHSVGPTLRHIGGGSAAVAVACGLIAVTANYPSWRELLSGLGTRVPVGPGARVWFSTQLGKYLPGSVWPIVMQMEAGRRWGASRRTMVAANLLTLFITCTTGLVIAAATLPFVDSRTVSRYWWALLFVPPLVVALHPRSISRILVWASALVRRPSTGIEVDWRHERNAAGWTVLYWAAIGMQTAVLAATVKGWSTSVVVVSIGATCLAVPLGVLFIPAPAGVGIREVVMGLALSSVMPAGRAVAIVIAARVVSTVCDLLAAGISVPLARAGGISPEDGGAGERTRTSTPLGTRT